MLFRDKNNKLIEIKRYDFKNDKIYYNNIINVLNNTNYKNNNHSKKRTVNKINSLLKNGIY